MSIGIIASQAFVPNKIAGLKLWLDASDANTVNTFGMDGFISRWSDKSSNNNDARQLSPVNQPFYRLNDINGLNSVDFSVATTLYFTLSSELVLTNLTIIAVFVSTTSPAGGQILAHSTLDRQALRFDPDLGGSFGRLSCNDGSSLSFNLTSSILNTPVILKSEYKVGSNKTLFLNGVVVATNSYLGSMDIDQVGRLLTNVENMGGKIGELILYDRPLSSAESVSIDNYLNNKWRINITFP